MHTHLNLRHAEANMAKTFHEVCKYLLEHSPNTVHFGRKTKYIIPDLTSQGAGLMDKIVGDNMEPEDNGDEAWTRDRATFADVVIEFGI